MKKKIIVILFSILAVATLTCGLIACDKSDEKNNDENESDSNIGATNPGYWDEDDGKIDSDIEVVEPGYWDEDDGLDDSLLLSNPGIEGDYGLEFTISPSENYYTVSGMKDDYELVTIPSMYYGLPVTTIGSNAFYECSSLKKVVIPEGVTSIGDYAFYHCTSLSSVSLPEGLETIEEFAFAYCPSITKMAFPEGLITIGNSAFYACSSLERISLPHSLSYIYNDAFTRCAELSSVYITDLETWCSIIFESGSANPLSIAEALFVDYVLASPLTIPNDVTSISNYAFYGYKSIRNLSIPDNVTLIGSYTFAECTSLKNVSFGNGLTSVGSNAFSGCTALESVYTEDLSEWCEIQFSNGTSNPLFNSGSLYLKGVLVEDLTIPSSVSSLNGYVFYGCSSITSLIIPDTVTSIGTYAFGGCKALGKVTIGSKVTFVGNYAFSDCTSIIGVYISDIASWCSISFGNQFSNPLCYSEKLYLNNVLLTSLVIPDSVTSVKAYTFYNCKLLTELTISENVTSLGNYAFYGCTALEKINFNAVSMNDLSSTNYVFYNAGRNGIGIAVSIGSYVTKIPSYLFYPCSVSSYSPKITTVFFGNNSQCTSAGNYAFCNCSSLLGVYINDIDSWCTISFGNQSANPLYYAKNLYLNNLLVTDVIISDKVQSIGSYCFYEYTALESLKIGSGVLTIGSYSFYECTNLTGIDIPDNVYWIRDYAFYDCVSLEYINIGNGVYSIGRDAFYGCTSAKSITIGNDVTSVGNYAFYNCTALSVIAFNAVYMSNFSSSNYVFYNAGKNTDGIIVTIGTAVTKIPAYTFYPYSSSTSPNISIVIFEDNSQCTSIGDYAFYYCSSLKSIVIPEGVTSISTYTFRYCSSLTEIVIPNTVTSIASGAFYGCSSLSNITLPFVGGSASATSASSSTLFGYIFGTSSYSGGTSTRQYYSSGSSSTYYIPSSLKTVILTGGNILYGAFYNCSNITSITIPESVTSLGSYAFYSCTALEEIHFNASVMNDLSASNYVFYNAGQSGSGIAVTVGSNVTKIPAYLFFPYSGSSYAPQIISVVFEDNSQCTSIGDYAFAYCSSLKTADIPSGVLSIGNRAFYSCSSLETIVIPEGILSIGNYAFYSCSSLVSVTIPNGVTSIESYTFRGCSSLVELIIPKSVTSIASAAFYGCISLESITIPFVGGSADATSSSSSTVFGYIFGTSSYTGSSAISQNYSGTSSATYYIPSSLKSVTVMGGNILYGAFYNCSFLNRIAITSDVNSIGRYAFYNCTSLSELYFNVPSLDDYSTSDYVFAYAGQNGEGIIVTIGADVIKIPAYLFCPYSSSSSYSPKITSVIFEENSQCSSIGKYSFSKCSSLEYVSLPDALTSIGNYAFYSCTALTSVTITDDVTSVGEYAFYGCTSLTDLTIGSGLSTLGDYAFYNCTALEGIWFNAMALDDLTSNNRVFYCAGQNSEGIKVIIGKSVTKIPEYIFYPYSSSSSYIPKIAIVVFEDGSICENIGKNAFNSCTYLTSIVIPDTVVSIGYSAFNNCSSLKTVYYCGNPSGWSNISKDLFNSTLTSATIYYYSEKEPDYDDEYDYWHYDVNGEIVIWVEEEN